MRHYVVEKTDRLEGEVHIQGAKNSVLPMIAASVMVNDVVIIHNCPDISDVHSMLELLEKLNVSICLYENSLYIDSTNAVNIDLEPEEMAKTRGGIILLGALIGRFGEAKIASPGGCNIGARPVDIHLDGMSKMNVVISDNDGMIEAYTDEIIANEITLRYPSVGATENMMLLATKANGKTIIKNAAKEPEIVELQNFLNKMGANIKGAGTDCIIINGVDTLTGGKYKVIGDRMVAATYMAAVASVGGCVTLKNVKSKYLKAEINVLKRLGCKIKSNKDSILIIKDMSKASFEPIHIETRPYPGFSTDAGACFVVAMLLGEGVSSLKETVFEDRYKIVSQLQKLGANISVLDGNVVVTYKSEKMQGEEVSATDLRGGAALVLAGLIANGITKIYNIEYICRGYEDIVRDLSSLGANITEKN